MSAIKGANTKPELVLRTLLFRAGYRYRLGEGYKPKGKRLPGSPDIVFPGRKVVIFINGCFWHRHLCAVFRWPATRSVWWKDKLDKNVSRDIAQWEALNKKGWRVLIVWECAIRGKGKLDLPELLGEVIKFFNSSVNLEAVAGKVGR